MRNFPAEIDLNVLQFLPALLFVPCPYVRTTFIFVFISDTMVNLASNSALGGCCVVKGERWNCVI